MYESVVTEGREVKPKTSNLEHVNNFQLVNSDESGNQRLTSVFTDRVFGPESLTTIIGSAV